MAQREAKPRRRHPEARGATRRASKGAVPSSFEARGLRPLAPQDDERAISLRLPLWLLDSLKMAASKRYVSHETLIKIWLAEKVEAE
jgi:hypothetical protein